MTTEEIQQEIERTRGEMAGTLQAIERKLDPRQLMNQAVDTMRELTSGESRIGTMVRENPVPLAVIGMGLGWLALSAAFGRRGAEDQGEAVVAASAAPGWAGGEPGYASAAGVGSSGYGAEGGQGFAPMGEAAQGMRERAGQMARGAREGLQRATDVTRRRVTEWSRSAGGAMGDAADRTWDLYQEHPLTMAMAAMAMGAAIGAILPRTRAEGQLMRGSMRSMAQQARETGSELVERAGQVARNALRTARRQGEGVAESAKEAAAGQATMH